MENTFNQLLLDTRVNILAALEDLTRAINIINDKEVSVNFWCESENFGAWATNSWEEPHSKGAPTLNTPGRWQPDLYVNIDGVTTPPTGRPLHKIPLKPGDYVYRSELAPIERHTVSNGSTSLNTYPFWFQEEERTLVAGTTSFDVDIDDSVLAYYKTSAGTPGTTLKQTSVNNGYYKTITLTSYLSTGAVAASDTSTIGFHLIDRSLPIYQLYLNGVNFIPNPNESFTLRSTDTLEFCYGLSRHHSDRVRAGGSLVFTRTDI
jgi:hypothetical protein